MYVQQNQAQSVPPCLWKGSIPVYNKKQGDSRISDEFWVGNCLYFGMLTLSLTIQGKSCGSAM